MKSKLFVFTVLAVAFLSIPVFAEKPLILFDSGHAQTAGNADWVINGGFSEFADVFKAQGCEVKSISKFTAEAVKGATVLVLPEPNSVYSPEEQSTIVNFVNEGGGLYAIADHNNSDRNGDGIDSVGVLNKFLPKLGLEINKLYFSEAPIAGAFLKTPITQNVKAVGSWGGTSIKCLSNTGVAHISVSDKKGGGAYIATNIVGSKGGKVVAMGDSSPYDDGTGDSHDKLHNGFSNPQFSHDILAANSARWLLEKKTETNLNRLVSLMADMDDAQVCLTRQNDSEPLRMFLENTERSILTVIKDNPDLRDVFRKTCTSKPVFSKLFKEVLAMDSFEKMHQE